MKKLHLGIDIGGTKTAIAIYDNDFKRLAYKSFLTEAKSGCKDLVLRIKNNVFDMLDENGFDFSQIVSCGAGCPGPIDLKTGTVIHIPTMNFKNENLAFQLSEALGINVKLEKDTNAAVLCESIFGKGKDFKTVTYITVSTGIGSATAIDKKVVWGGNSAAGELGHITVEQDGLLCGCGKKGCLELYSSGTGIANITSKKLGKKVSAKETFDLARDGDNIALDVIKNAAYKLGYAISLVYQLLDPDIIVLGGSVTKDYEFFKPYLFESISRYTQKVAGRDINIELSNFDGEQVLLGAAYYGSI